MRKLLIADANCWSAYKIAALLKEYYTVEVVEDPQFFMDLADGFQPDVVVLDFTMPRLDYMDALRILRMSEPRPLIIGTTCYTPDEHLELLYDMGVRYILEKPFIHRRLVERVLELDTEQQRKDSKSATGILLKLGFGPHFNGYQALLRCIEYAVEHPGCAVVKQMYPFAGDLLGMSPSQVEHSCRTCISAAWATRELYTWCKFFPEHVVCGGRPISNKAFIQRIAAWLTEM